MMKATKLCFAIPASPTEPFFSQIAMFRLALDHLGGVYKKADIIIFFGHAGGEMEIPARWQPLLSKNVKVHWTPEEEFAQYSYLAQGDSRWRYDYADYDLVIFSDADTILIRPIDDLIEQTKNAPAVCGVIAYLPFKTEAGSQPHEVWDQLANHFLGKPIEFRFKHPLVDPPEQELADCPFYLNFGFIMMTSGLIDAIRDEFLELRPKISPLLFNPYFCAQAAIPLLVEKLGIPTREVGLRFNFPNMRRAEDLYEEEFADIRVIHYMRRKFFSRETVFTSREFFDEFMQQKLVKSDAVFQAHIRKITGGKYPF